MQDSSDTNYRKILDNKENIQNNDIEKSKDIDIQDNDIYISKQVDNNQDSNTNDIHINEKMESNQQDIDNVDSNQDSNQYENKDIDEVAPNEVLDKDFIIENGENVKNIESNKDIDSDMIMLDNIEIENKEQDWQNHNNNTITKDSNLIRTSNEEKQDINDNFLEEILLDKKKKKKKIRKNKYKWNYILYSKRLFVSTALIACFIGLYAGYLLFGSTSLKVLWNLNETKNRLSKEVEENRQENATLQKKVLELKALEPK